MNKILLASVIIFPTFAFATNDVPASISVEEMIEHICDDSMEQEICDPMTIMPISEEQEEMQEQKTVIKKPVVTSIRHQERKTRKINIPYLTENKTPEETKIDWKEKKEMEKKQYLMETEKKKELSIKPTLIKSSTNSNVKKVEPEEFKKKIQIQSKRFVPVKSKRTISIRKSRKAKLISPTSKINISTSKTIRANTKRRYETPKQISQKKVSLNTTDASQKEAIKKLSTYRSVRSLNRFKKENPATKKIKLQRPMSMKKYTKRPLPTNIPVNGYEDDVIEETLK